MSYKKMQIQKELYRKCPECGGTLNIIEYISKKKGYTYTEHFIECELCDYFEEYTGARKKYKRINNMD